MSPLSSLTINPDGFAFNTATGESYTLNRCARFIIHRLNLGETEAQIIQAIAQEFDVAHSIIERDVADFFQQLHTLGFAGARV